MTDEQLQAIRDRAEKATPGEWEYSPAGRIYKDPLDPIAFVGGRGNQAVADADFIAHAHTDIPALLAALDAANAKLDKAVGDMNVMALAMRENDELSEACCFACICDGANLPEGVILPYGECPGYERNDCFEWRGDAAEEAT